MAATNKIPNYKAQDGRISPIILHLPVQAGATQAIKAGEICKLINGDFTTNAIVPAGADAVGFTPVIAWEEQSATDAARIMMFALPMRGDQFEFSFASSTTPEYGQGIALVDSQTIKVAAATAIADAVVEPTIAPDTYQAVTKCFVSFRASDYNILQPNNVLATYTVATAPTTKAGAVAYINDGAAGNPVLAFSDGTDWLRSDTLAAVSAS